MNRRKIEIFTAGCPLCNPVVNMVKELASETTDEVIVYDLVKQCENGPVSYTHLTLPTTPYV